MRLKCRSLQAPSPPAPSASNLQILSAIYIKREILTFFGLLKVTLVIPGTFVRASLEINLRAFFSLREWTIWVPPVAPPSPVSISESEPLSDASSSAVTFLVGSSSGSSSIRGFDMMGIMSGIEELARLSNVLCVFIVKDSASDLRQTLTGINRAFLVTREPSKIGRTQKGD